MKDGFNHHRFISYMEHQFPSVFVGDGGSFTRELLENLIEYAHEYMHVSKDQFCEFLSSLIPEVEMGEVAAFMDDRNLTCCGIVEKRRAIEKYGI